MSKENITFSGKFGLICIFLGIGFILFGVVYSFYFGFTVNKFMLNGGIYGILFVFSSIIFINLDQDFREKKEKQDLKQRVEKLEGELQE